MDAFHFGMTILRLAYLWLLVQMGILVPMNIGFGLFGMFVVEAGIQLHFYRLVSEFVWFLLRTAIS